MIRILGKTLLILIATVMVADPVMACCFPTSLSTEQSVLESEAPPCHGSKQSTRLEPKTTTDSGSTLCPGCGDCSSAMMAIESVDNVAAVLTMDEDRDVPFDVSNKPEAVALEIPAVLNAPSGPPLRSTSSPVTLKQILLI